VFVAGQLQKNGAIDGEVLYQKIHRTKRSKTKNIYISKNMQITFPVFVACAYFSLVLNLQYLPNSAC
jgi:hypothetical protein